MDTFLIDSMSNGKTHLGTKDKIPLCGANLDNPSLTSILCRLGKDDNLEIMFLDTIQRKKWLDESSNTSEYCKKCLKQNGVKG